MARVAPRIPDPSDILCESCGYVLNGLPPDGRCPECGAAVADSTGSARHPTPWDTAVTAGGVPKFGPFLRTTGAVVWSTKRFYQTLAVRSGLAASRRFASIHWGIAAVLFGVAAATHADWFLFVIGGWRAFPVPSSEPVTYGALLVAFTAGTYFALSWTTRLAASLTRWEGSYRGYRVPTAVVLRVMYFHAAHYLPVAAVAAGAVVGFRVRWILWSHEMGSYPGEGAEVYLYTLCGLVVVSAAYLFQTYWTGMRAVLYANR